MRNTWRHLSEETSARVAQQLCFVAGGPWGRGCGGRRSCFILEMKL